MHKERSHVRAPRQEHFELGRADFKPVNKTITLGEWLEYARERVPQLFEEVKRGQVRSQRTGAAEATKIIILSETASSGGKAGPAGDLIQGKPIGVSTKATIAEEQIQRPALFDFARKWRDVVC